MNTATKALGLIGIGASIALTGCSTDHSNDVTHSSSSATLGGNNDSSANPEAFSTPTKNAKTKSALTSGYIKSDALKINASVYAAGANKAGIINPTPGKVQWVDGYNSVLPGKNGNAIFAGHVTYNGPDVFNNLMKAKKGMEIDTVTNGYEKRWKITEVKTVDKKTAQTDDAIWGKHSTPQLILVTCDSNSPMMNAHHHKDNYVIWASPI